MCPVAWVCGAEVYVSAVGEEFTVRSAKTLEEATQLMESGFEYITEMEGVKLFRERK